MSSETVFMPIIQINLPRIFPSAYFVLEFQFEKKKHRRNEDLQIFHIFLTFRCSLKLINLKFLITHQNNSKEQFPLMLMMWIWISNFCPHQLINYSSKCLKLPQNVCILFQNECLFLFFFVSAQNLNKRV